MKPCNHRLWQALGIHIGWLMSRVEAFQREVRRLNRVLDAGDGGHEWNEKERKCSICGMHFSFYKDELVICKGPPDLHILEYEI